MASSSRGVYDCRVALNWKSPGSGTVPDSLNSCSHGMLYAGPTSWPVIGLVPDRSQKSSSFGLSCESQRVMMLRSNV